VERCLSEKGGWAFLATTPMPRKRASTKRPGRQTAAGKAAEATAGRGEAEPALAPRASRSVPKDSRWVTGMPTVYSMFPTTTSWVSASWFRGR